MQELGDSTIISLCSTIKTVFLMDLWHARKKNVKIEDNISTSPAMYFVFMKPLSFLTFLRITTI